MRDKFTLFEKYFLINTLKKHSWNKTRAAEELGISRQALDVKIKKHEINKKSLSPDPREFLIDKTEEEPKMIRHSFSISSDELEALKLLVKKLNRGSPRRVSLSEIIRLAIKHLKEKNPEEIQSDLLD